MKFSVFITTILAAISSAVSTALTIAFSYDGGHAVMTMRGKNILLEYAFNRNRAKHYLNDIRITHLNNCLVKNGRRLKCKM